MARKPLSEEQKKIRRERFINCNPNLSPEEKRSMLSAAGKKGGVRSGEVRRARKTFKENLKMLLSLQMLPEGTGNEDLELFVEGLRSYNEDIEDLGNLTINDLISMAQINNALKGDNRAFENIRDTVGEKPVEEVKSNIFAEGLNITIDDGE